MKTAKKSSKTLLTRVSEVFTKQEPPAPVPILPPVVKAAEPKPVGRPVAETVCSVNPVEAQTRETF